MRIALAHPLYWPEATRGTERIVHDLGSGLAGRGHQVTLLTAHPGPRTVSDEDGMSVVRSRRLPEPSPLRWYERFLVNAPNVLRELRPGRYDVVYAFSPADAWAALGARRLGGPPVLFSLQGIPTREYLVKRRYRLEMLGTVLEKAAGTQVLSRATADAVMGIYGRETEVIPAGAVMSEFAVDADRAEPPTLFCAASLGDPRKRADVLFAGFERLRARRPEVRLAVARPRDPALSEGLPELPQGAGWADADSMDTGGIAAAYASATASVLPSVEEAFGVVLVESLAAGTPVVAARSGACPEIVDERIGRLFEPDDPESLATAMEAALDLGADLETDARCRLHAARWDWEALVPAYERWIESRVPAR
jgi:glycosyltransferase involved in cell wall biosynthesis